ncbi:HPr family phosphocarrier protein [Paenibacillus methanolicus]|uniref:Phosphocarrier protein n=1 Tax=Paenibacillus methanolicus TaxID=582686 RepID=A0A5S5CI50_9BACL|nr:HPr family phosphocarrier protein [Paenibacillus methanolicus]TYP79469.1 phosphocarrier protein [Paenibacillus methanolicus]
MDGLGTRAIVDINQTANRFRSSIVMKAGSRIIDVKSILGLSFSLLGHDRYELDIHGPDEEVARDAMLDVFRKHDLAAVLTAAQDE